MPKQLKNRRKTHAARTQETPGKDVLGGTCPPLYLVVVPPRLRLDEEGAHVGDGHLHHPLAAGLALDGGVGGGGGRGRGQGGAGPPLELGGGSLWERTGERERVCGGLKETEIDGDVYGREREGERGREREGEASHACLYALVSGMVQPLSLSVRRDISVSSRTTRTEHFQCHDDEDDELKINQYWCAWLCYDSVMTLVFDKVMRGHF